MNTPSQDLHADMTTMISDESETISISNDYQPSGSIENISAGQPGTNWMKHMQSFLAEIFDTHEKLRIVLMYTVFVSLDLMSSGVRLTTNHLISWNESTITKWNPPSQFAVGFLLALVTRTPFAMAVFAVLLSSEAIGPSDFVYFGCGAFTDTTVFRETEHLRKLYDISEYILVVDALIRRSVEYLVWLAFFVTVENISGIIGLTSHAIVSRFSIETGVKNGTQLRSYLLQYATYPVSNMIIKIDSPLIDSLKSGTNHSLSLRKKFCGLEVTFDVEKSVPVSVMEPCVYVLSGDQISDNTAGIILLVGSAAVGGLATFILSRIMRHKFGDLFRKVAKIDFGSTTKAELSGAVYATLAESTGCFHQAFAHAVMSARGSDVEVQRLVYTFAAGSTWAIVGMTFFVVMSFGKGESLQSGLKGCLHLVQLRALELTCQYMLRLGNMDFAKDISRKLATISLDHPRKLSVCLVGIIFGTPFAMTGVSSLSAIVGKSMSVAFFAYFVMELYFYMLRRKFPGEDRFPGCLATIVKRLQDHLDKRRRSTGGLREA